MDFRGEAWSGEGGRQHSNVIPGARLGWGDDLVGHSTMEAYVAISPQAVYPISELVSDLRRRVVEDKAVNVRDGGQRRGLVG